VYFHLDALLTDPRLSDQPRERVQALRTASHYFKALAQNDLG